MDALHCNEPSLTRGDVGGSLCWIPGCLRSDDAVELFQASRVIDSPILEKSVYMKGGAVSAGDRRTPCWPYRRQFLACLARVERFDTRIDIQVAALKVV